MESMISFERSINSGMQVGSNFGSITSHFHLPPGNWLQARPETPPAPVSTVPFTRDPDFIDRGGLLDRIQEKCFGSPVPTLRIAFVGLGGVGKSQLAIELCYRLRDKFSDTWVFWVYASSTARFQQSYREIANWAHERKRWILILDNVDDEHILHASVSVKSDQTTSQQPFLAFLPHSSNGSIIMTNEPMTESQALTLLEIKLGNLAKEESKDDIVKLAKELNFLSLAMVQAAAYMKQRAPRSSVTQYLGDFQRSDHRKVKLLDYEAGHPHRDLEASNSILTTWQLSFDLIRQTRPSAADLLGLMSFFDRHRIPEALLQSRCFINLQNRHETDILQNPSLNEMIDEVIEFENGPNDHDKRR
ncbi:hypothetical protein N7462_005956 [Penicillium macrosclerotiorum]|uniref:uncharacterized protein n=1 Tax=Penicillium macrosclerotiorum TaxID=303699 RepID=UPI002548C1B2|nr:uncharacterized protein N7462_005956 [Penicillium macrosclerotiorum]KAJ5682791.1 hypothetical protein N7462_005956 [Penicillium macrosclerotiorum]